MAVTVEFLETLATDLLENNHLVRPCIICENGSLHDSTLDIRCAHLYLSFVINKENLVELHVSAFCLREPLNEDFVASLNLELLACNFYDCVHLKNFLKVSAASVCHRRQHLIELDGHQ